MKKSITIVSVLLAVVLLISSLPIAMAQSTVGYNYDNSVWVTLQAEQSLSVEELSAMLQVDTCLIMDKQTKENGVAYQLVVGNEEESVEDTIERMQTVEGVTHAGRNVYAPDYGKKESYLTLNQTQVVIPVGGTATLKVTDARLVFDEKEKAGIVVGVDHSALPFAQFLEMITTTIGWDDDWDTTYFYALYEDDYDWESNEQYLFLGFWGSNEYGPRRNTQSPIGKYLLPQDFINNQPLINQLAQTPAITEVRFAYEMAPGGIPPHEKWTVQNTNIVGMATDAQDEFSQFYTVTVVGKQVGETQITVQHGEGTCIVYATCTVTVVEANPQSPTDIVWGDVTGDREIDAKDALNVLKYAVNKLEFTPKEQLAADVTDDQKIDAKDALEILKYSVKKITKFPVEQGEVTPTNVLQ